MGGGERQEDGWAGGTQRDSSAMDAKFVRRLGRLLLLAGAEKMLPLVILSAVNVVVVSKMGHVAGAFYLALVDADIDLFWIAVRDAAVWYTATALCAAAHEWVVEGLVLQWRTRLTRLCHTAYCKEAPLYMLSHGFSPSSTKNQAAAIDNPDQRIAQEIQDFCLQICTFVSRTVTVPLMIVFYTALVWSYVGLSACFAIYSFFFIGAALNRWIISPIASLVAKQEMLEANFRMSHVRLREHAEGIAMYKSATLEGCQLDADLARVLANQKQLMLRHLLLSTATKLFDYMGSMMNYLVLSIPVFGGAFGGTEDKGATAQLISNSSFAILQLIYSFTQVIDASKILSDVAGHTSRVAELFEFLGLIPSSSDSVPNKPTAKAKEIQPFISPFTSLSPLLNCKGSDQLRIYGTWLSEKFSSRWCDREATEKLLQNSGHEGRNRENDDVQIKVSDLEAGFGEGGDSRSLEREGLACSGMLQGPIRRLLPQGGEIEYSIHTVPDEMQAHLAEVFPGANLKKMLIVPTFQCGAVDICHIQTPASAQGDKDQYKAVAIGTQQFVMMKAEENREKARGENANNGEKSSRQVIDLKKATGEVQADDVFYEMDQMLERFLCWENTVCTVLRRRGYWADAIDPRTGFPLTPNGGQLYEKFRDLPENPPRPVGRLSKVRTLERKGENGRGQKNHIDRCRVRYSEVIGAKVLLNYSVQMVGSCPVVEHPVFGTHAFPASLFTCAPFAELEAAMAAAERGEGSAIGGAERSITAEWCAVEQRRHEERGELGGDERKAGDGKVDEEVESEWWGNRGKEGRRKDKKCEPRCGDGGGGGEQGNGLETGGTMCVRGDGQEKIENEFFALILDKVTCSVFNNGMIVVTNLSARVKHGEGLLLEGPSGAGKTSLARAICGLWPLQSGSVHRPERVGHKGVIYLPQKPLLARGGLAAQITYPDQPPSVLSGDSRGKHELGNKFQSLLEIVGLCSLLERVRGDWMVPRDWANELSPGERQALSLTRVLHHLPILAVLDESTSAISEEFEDKIYSHIQRLGIATLSISHKSRLQKWHKQVLKLKADGEGGWNLEENQARGV